MYMPIHMKSLIRKALCTTFQDFCWVTECFQALLYHLHMKSFLSSNKYLIISSLIFPFSDCKLQITAQGIKYLLKKNEYINVQYLYEKLCPFLFDVIQRKKSITKKFFHLVAMIESAFPHYQSGSSQESVSSAFLCPSKSEAMPLKLEG